MAKIKKLSEEVINLIAAGEVVERPASAVKELIENSIDAKSKKINLYIEGDGTELIKVVDNGIGMDKEDALLAFTQHATSKISTKSDLDNINSYGFRGEALASISAISKKTTVNTKTEQSEAVTVINENSILLLKENRQETNGTTIIIENLFEKTPVRKKFLKKSGTEIKHIHNTFLQTAIPHININFELYIDNKEALKLTKVNSIRDRLFEIFGTKFTNNTYESAYEINNINIKSVIGNSFLGQKKNNTQYIFINDRYIKSPLIHQAVRDAYRGFIHTDLQPSYLLFIKIKPETVDVNVHPRKLEVRFNDEQLIYKSVFTAIKTTLLDQSKISTTEKFNFTNKIESTNLPEKYTSYSTPQVNANDPFKNNNKHKTNYSIQQAIDFTKNLYNKEFVDNNVYVNDIVDVKYQNKPIQKNSLNLNSKKYLQIFNTYILIESDNKLIIIDQHASAEKIIFEKLIKQLGNIKTKPLLIPEIISFATTHEKNEIIDLQEELKSLGVYISDFGLKEIQVTEIPEILNENINIENLLKECLSDKETSSIIYDKHLLDEMKISHSVYIKIATIACHGSIRAGQVLSNEEMANIVEGILLLEEPGNCPHGRPILWSINKSEIENNFNRNI